MNDQTSPKHYQTKIQPIDFIQANNLNFCEGNIIKYIARYREKGGIDDLLKAKQYIDYLIKDYEDIEKDYKDYEIMKYYEKKYYETKKD
jgi:hypothetical protein